MNDGGVMDEMTGAKENLMELVEFDEDDRKLFLEGLHNDIEKAKDYSDTQIYNLILGTIKSINEAREHIDQLYNQFMVLNNILALRILDEPFNEFGCIGCEHIVGDEGDGGDLDCSHPLAHTGAKGMPSIVCSDAHSCPYYHGEGG